jgi:hypothetical protein
VNNTQKSRQRKEISYVLLFSWAVWVACFAHYRWSTKVESVYPLISPIKTNGTAEEFRIDNVPTDTYDIFLAFKAPDSENRHELQAQLRRAIDASPIDIQAVVTDRRGNEVVLQFEGDTTTWVVGSVHIYRPDTGIEYYIAVFDPRNKPLSFEARSRRDYRLSLSTRAQDSIVLDQTMLVLVKGSRDDGKIYPVKYMMGLSVSFLLLLVLSMMLLAARLNASANSPPSNATDE